MSQEIKVSFLTLSGLLIAFFVTHNNFSSFEPKVLVPLKKVQGMKAENEESSSRVEVNVPYPENSETLGVVKTERTEQHTIKSPLSPQEGQEFYKNVLKSQDWVIENEGTAGIFLNTEYKKEKARIKITTSQDGDHSIISVEINQRN